MKTDNFYYRSGQSRFRIFSNIDEVSTTYRIKEKMGPVSDSANADGFLVSETLDGLLLSVVSFCREFFPYDDAISFHVFIPAKQEKYRGTTALLKSFFLLGKVTGVFKLISRHAPENIETLLMLLDIGFKVSELAYHSKRHVLVERLFDKKFFESFDFSSRINIQDIYSNSRVLNPVRNRQKRQSTLTDSDTRILNKWLGISKNMGFFALKEIDTLLQKQEHLRCTELADGKEIIVFAQNIEISGGLILCSNQSNSRRQFFLLYQMLNEDNAITVYYTSAYNDFINSVLFLSGYTNASIVEENSKDHLYKWERI